MYVTNASVTQIGLNDTEWPHGPQYTFLGRINLTVDTTDEQLFGLNVTITTNLICRPRNIDTLNCHFETWRGKVLKRDENGTSDETTHAENFDIEGPPFDIKFDENGIKNYIIPANYSKSEIFNVMKPIVNLLHIKSSVVDKSDEELQGIESFSLGNCLSKYHVKSLPSESEDKETEDANYELDLLYSSNHLSKTIFNIVKERDLQQCDDLIPFLYSFMIVAGVENMENLKYDSSIESVNITNTTFDVYGKEVAYEPQKKLRFLEEFGLSLEGISPAQEELPVIPNPVSTSMQYYVK